MWFTLPAGTSRRWATDPGGCTESADNDLLQLLPEPRASQLKVQAERVIERATQGCGQASNPVPDALDID